MRSKRALIMKPADNVATALEEIEVGDQINVRLEQEVRIVEAKEVIPFGFKVALTNILEGEPVIKYGEVIGNASADINKGYSVHVHNLEGTRGRGDLIESGGKT